jgi:hypothetical protein
MEWTLRLVGTEIDGQSRSCEVMAISRRDGLGDIAALGLTLAEAKLLLVQVQQEVVAAQARQHTRFRPDCQSCSGRCHVKGWRPHRIATLFGEVRVKLPRLTCAGGGCGETGGGWPSHCRSTPELDQLQARLSALMPYRVAADVLLHLLPIDAGRSPETLRSHTLQVGKSLGAATTAAKLPAATAITVTLDSTFIRRREDSERHLEVRVGNVETGDGGRQVFGAVTRADTDLTALLHRNLETVGRTDATEVTAFTDGCSGLRTVLANAGVTKPPILDCWGGRPHGIRVPDLGRHKPRPEPSMSQITRIGIDTSKAVFTLHCVHAIDKYLRGQAAWLVNYAKRYRAGERVGTSITEGTANFLVNRRMNKSQQMRWSRNGADLLLQVRCAVYNGTLGAGFGHRFDRIARADLTLAQAA